MDLNNDGVSDCSQTLVANSAFTCGVAPDDVYETSEEFEKGTRLTLRGTKGVDRTGSMLVRLSVIKPFRVDSFSVRFDNVLIHAQ